MRSPYFRLRFLWLNFHKNKTTQTFSCITSDSIGWRKYLLPSRVIAYIYIHPILRTTNSIADILAWYNYAWALLEYITRLAFRRVEKKLGSCSISFLVHPGRSPGMMLLCLSASRIYNTFSISTRSRKKKFRQLFYILSGSSRLKSWHDVIMPERF